VWDRAPKTGLAIAQKCLFRTYILGIAVLLAVFPAFLATGGSHRVIVFSAEVAVSTTPALQAQFGMSLSLVNLVEVRCSLKRGLCITAFCSGQKMARILSSARLLQEDRNLCERERCPSAPREHDWAV
jgi:hypothetical protein